MNKYDIVWSHNLSRKDIAEKQGPAGQRCVHEANEANEAHEAHEAHIAHIAYLAHPAHQTHSAMSMLDCPNNFHIENGSFSAFKKTGYHPTDHRTIGPSIRRTDGHDLI